MRFSTRPRKPSWMPSTRMPYSFMATLVMARTTALSPGRIATGGQDARQRVLELCMGRLAEGSRHGENPRPAGVEEIRKIMPVLPPPVGYSMGSRPWVMRMMAGTCRSSARLTSSPLGVGAWGSRRVGVSGCSPPGCAWAPSP